MPSKAVEDNTIEHENQRFVLLCIFCSSVAFSFCFDVCSGLMALQEGNAYQYLWDVQHDPAGLVSLFGSPEAFDASLETFFAKHVSYQEKWGSSIPNPFYWAGNEHDMFAPLMFNFGADCTRSQYWMRRLQLMHYSNSPHGVPGNEDYGAMASWLLFASLGNNCH